MRPTERDDIRTFYLWRDAVVRQAARLRAGADSNPMDSDLIPAWVDEQLADAHLFVVAYRHLLLAADRALGRDQVDAAIAHALRDSALIEPYDFRAILTAVRDLLEHWDEQLDNYSRGVLVRAGSRLEGLVPGAYPWLYEIPGSGGQAIIGGALDIDHAARIRHVLESKILNA